jgi:hypothetical protein
MSNHSGSSDACVQLSAALDRHAEAHWHLHQLNENYHRADPFRWSLNSFLRALKEVPQQIQMHMQNQPGFSAWFRPHKQELERDPLFKLFSEHRDFVVHRGTLIPKSTVQVGVLKAGGAAIRLGVPFTSHPMEDTDHVMVRFVEMCQREPVLAGLARPQGDQLPYVHREWRLNEFPDEEIRFVVVRAWKRVGETISAVLEHRGHAPTSWDFPCLADHVHADVQFKAFEATLFDGVP